MRISLLFTLLILCLFQTNAQITVVGQVIDFNDQSPIIGANIIEIGKESNGTLTDIDGKYTITVEKDATLKFSYLGYTTQEIPVDGKNQIDVVLVEDSYQLDKVVVTAYGIEKEKKATGFAFSEVDGQELNTAKEVTVAAQLTGKVAGLDVTKPSNGPSGSTRIVIRGISGFGSGSSLIVIDGVPADNTNKNRAGLYGGRDSGDGFNSLNPDDIENITVLKGPAASALYGSRAGSGVILITTKKGKQQKGIGVEYSSNFTTEAVFLVPKFQEEYGQGANGEKPTTQLEAFENWRSWGAKLDGSMTPIFNGESIPYSAAGSDDIRSFYDRGNTWTNNLSFTGGNKIASTRVSLSQLSNNGIVPNTTYDRYTANLNVIVNVTKNISLDGKINYAHEKAFNRTNLTDNPANPSKYFTVGPNNLPHAVFEQTRDEDGNPIYWSANPFTLSPYWGPLENINRDNKDRFISYLIGKWEIMEGFSIQARAATDRSEHRFFNTEIDGTQFITQGSIDLDTLKIQEDNYDFIVNYKKDFTPKFGIDVNLGTTRTDRSTFSSGVFGNTYIESQLSEFSNLANQFTRPRIERTFRINALFATTTISINNYLYIDGSIRKDFFSVLTNPRDPGNSENSVLYGSGSLSFILSDAIKAPDWLSFAKLRLGYGTSGSIGTITPYSLLPNYNISIEELKDLQNGSVVFGNIGGDVYANPLIKPALTTGIEFGTDLSFFSSRVNLDLTFYRQRTNKHIFQSPLPISSGYSSQIINAGEIENKGVEMLLRTAIVRKRDFEWELAFNFTKNINKVVSLSEGVDKLSFGPDRTFSAEVVATLDGQVGDILGNVYARNDAGQIIHEDGLPKIAEEREVLGNFTPDWYGGITSNFSYKNWNLSFIIDTKQGGEILSTTSSFGYLFGKHINSLKGRDNPNFEIIGEGVGADGVSPNTTPARIDDYYERISTISEENVYDASYIKFRQLSISYSMDKKLLARTKFIRSATISLVGRNLFFITNGLDIIGLDPESIYTSTGGDIGIEYAALPSTRSYGFNLNLKF